MRDKEGVYRIFEDKFDNTPDKAGCMGKIDPKSIKDEKLRELIGSGKVFQGEDGLHVGSLIVKYDGKNMAFLYNMGSNDEPEKLFSLEKRSDGGLVYKSSSDGVGNQKKSNKNDIQDPHVGDFDVNF